MSEERRSILERVASGELSPEAASKLLDEMPATPTPVPPPPSGPASGEAPPFEPVTDAGSPTPTPPPPPPATATQLHPAGAATGPVERVRVVRSLGATRIYGDPQVQEAVAEGPHRAERLARELVIHGDLDDGGFSFSRVQGHWNQRNDRLTVRMRPDLPLEVQAQGASVQVQDVTGRISGDVQAASLSIEGARGPLDLGVQAGSLNVSGTFTQGTSRLRCEAGSVRVALRAGSSVRVVARSTMGHLSLPGDGLDRVDEVVMGGGTREVTVGAGDALLEIESTMGSVRISRE